MKKVIAIGILLNAALLAGILLKDEVIVHAAGECGRPKGNGDVNGDGGIDISDAVHLLSGLFLGGPAPCPIECPEPPRCDSCCPPTRLPATGQTKCYDNFGSEIDCASADFPGQDGFYQAGCPMEGRFVDNLDGTVTDTCTGLMWQKDTADVSGNGSIGDEDRLTWQGALRYCDNLSFAGHDDWRLPNVQELFSIEDYGRLGPSIFPVFGPVTERHWSSSSHVSDPVDAWYANFNTGSVVFGQNKNNSLFVRAVRAGLVVF